MAKAKAKLLIRDRTFISEEDFVEVVIWLVPEPVRASAHPYKYRLALVAAGECVLRYDNEAGKGDHLHRGVEEMPYAFRSIDQLEADFWRDVREWISLRSMSSR